MLRTKMDELSLIAVKADSLPDNAKPTDLANLSNYNSACPVADNCWLLLRA